MFTNWLTGSSGNSTTTLPPPTVATTPPDIVLEVGPAPSVRFVAHSIILSMHSGYLRSALRMDESGGGNSPEMVLFLMNVTPEQFAPLLTYMYTGYLDLNMENIFSVLLATHVLHMPRALEICRAFLSRAQSEGYLNSGHFINNSHSKIIRPIASKASMPNLGFIAPPMQHISLPSIGTPFKSLQPPGVTGNTTVEDLSDSDSQSIAVTSPKPLPHPTSNDKELSSSTQSSNIPSNKRQNRPKRSNERHRNKTPSSSSAVSSLFSKDNTSQSVESENKTIIDVASCDGPIRFRRVLNDAYGFKSETLQYPPAQERTQQSVSHSFHQQMAKTISQRQLQSEESENSEDLNGKSSAICPKTKNGEIYNCVYCNHTFKSQYCYQKHAKRHLNPLSLDCTSTKKSTRTATSPSNSISLDGDLEKDEKTPVPLGPSTITDVQRREVRPLDMNVQYYPCKMCGSKFPSYYFVHKHRKMCHAGEEHTKTDSDKNEN